jgi:hypothetical protein
MKRDIIFFFVSATIMAAIIVFIWPDKKHKSSAPTPPDSNFSISETFNAPLPFYVVVDKRTGTEYLFSYRGGGVKVEK